jgi:4-hydroxybenzoate polyprenyltransferase
MDFIRTIFTISRPRFWPYLAGPWAIGWLVSSQFFSDMLHPFFWVGLVFFLWPANFFVYGINDWADQDTDIFNTKKQGYEKLYNHEYHRVIMILMAFFSILGLYGAWFMSDWQGVALYIFWWVLCFGYSVSPLRFKARPFLDSWSNILYIMPGVMAYVFQSGWSTLSWVLVAAAAFWSMGMHLFSALPDIEADTRANLKTTAVFLGFKSATLLTGLYYALSSMLIGIYGSVWLGVVFTLYVFIVVYAYLRTNSDTVIRLYKMFPVVNFVMGSILFWSTFYLKFFV